MRMCTFFTTLLILITNILGAQQNRLAEIDAELTNLHYELSHLRNAEMKEEIEAQNYMRYRWKQFAKDIEDAENEEQKIAKIKKRIEELESERNDLIKSSQ